MLTTKDIQKRLLGLGYDPGPVDGVRGALTIRAILRFQADHGLAGDGVVGPATCARLFAETSDPVSRDAIDLPWYEEGQRLMGIREAEGRGSNRRILDWASGLGLDYGSDDIPWCGLFVAHCIGTTLPNEPLPSGILGARNWRRFGRGCRPTQGAVLVFWRTDRTRSPNGHVGFYAGEDDDAYHVLGGNQSDRVSITRIRRDRLLDARFPRTVPDDEGRIVRLTPTTDAFSVDEA